MAQRRMINISIAYSESVNAMTEWAQLAFVFALPHLDDFGIIPGSPAKLKAITKPLSERPPDEFASAASEWIRHEIVRAYLGDDGRVYLRAVNFDHYQSGLNKRTRSRFPDDGRRITADEYLNLPNLAGKFREVPLQLNGTEPNGNEENENKARTEQRGLPEHISDAAPTRSRSSKLFDVNSIEMRLAKLHCDLIKGRRPTLKEPNLDRWAAGYDSILNVDGRSAEETEQVLRWSQADAFWSKNILSPDSLRKHFDKLALQKANPNSKRREGQYVRTSRNSQYGDFNGVDDLVSQ